MPGLVGVKLALIAALGIALALLLLTLLLWAAPGHTEPSTAWVERARPACLLLRLLHPGRTSLLAGLSADADATLVRCPSRRAIWLVRRLRACPRPLLSARPAHTLASTGCLLDPEEILQALTRLPTVQRLLWLVMRRLFLVISGTEVRRPLMVLIPSTWVFKSALAVIEVILRRGRTVRGGRTRTFTGGWRGGARSNRRLVWVDRGILRHVRLTVRRIWVSGVRVLRIVWRIVVGHWCWVALLLSLLTSCWLTRGALWTTRCLRLACCRTQRRRLIRLRDRQATLSGLVMH